MKLAELLSELQVRGHWLGLEGTGLRCHGPQPLARDLAAEIQRHKDELRRQLLELNQAQAERAAPVESDVGYGAAGSGLQGWVVIDGVPYSPAAADLYRRSVPLTGAAANDRCCSCSGTRFWRLRDGCPWVCARCHPSGRAESEVEWREGAGISPRLDPMATPTSAPLAPKLNPGVAHG